MKVHLDSLDPKVYHMLVRMGRIADQQKVKAFIVGGIVRDLFLGRANMDIDIVVEGDGPGFARQVAKEIKSDVKIHSKFKTATIQEWQGLHIDVVSARGENYPQPGALPVIFLSSLRDDLRRRDFTINAIAVSINNADQGELIDFYQGVDDLEKGIIRIFHDQSFMDDPTRILRAIRFEQRLGFKLSSKTGRLLRQAIEQRAEKNVSPSRFFNEFVVGLDEECPGKYISRLKNLGALAFLGEAAAIKTSVLKRFDQAVVLLREKGFSQRVFFLAGLFATCYKEKILDYGNRFQWPREEKKQIIRMVCRFHDYNDLKKKSRKSAEILLMNYPEDIKFFIQLIES